MNTCHCQDEQAFMVKDIYDFSLSQGHCDDWLQYLSDSIGGRLAGSQEALDAVDYTKSVLERFEIVDSSWKQACTVPVWVRGEKEILKFSYQGQTIQIPALALGNTVGTGSAGISGEIIEVFGFDTLEILGEEIIKDKIIFYNRPMDPKKIITGHAYGEAVDQRVHGASKASKYGAAAVLVRSMTNRLDDWPHTGVQLYARDIKPIPALAISTNEAEELSSRLKDGPVSAFMKTSCEVRDSSISYNVIAEIKGSTHPDEISLVGGHLDSWDVGGGAHDDGAGCVHAMQVIETLNALGYQPKRTIRCVLFMNEENGLGGGLAYAKASNENGEFHLAALESDAGGFTPRGFACSADPEVFKTYLANFQKFDEFLDPYDLYLKAGGGGADIGPLKSQKGLLIGFRPDSQRYFDFHHTKEDVFSNVHPRELKLGAAAITSLIYLIDQFGL
ncbi:MAG: M20/M25/M40 family metallo-hydrolase [Bacteroidia bacterium]|nr:M20/M25/M40 family metallo-hydrolase [Bacteroidia bacterium]